MKVLILSADNFEDSELLVPLYRLQEAGHKSPRVNRALCRLSGAS